jgi:NitT/TauT family transport system substrate-binding protein
MFFGLGSRLRIGKGSFMRANGRGQDMKKYWSQLFIAVAVAACFAFALFWHGLPSARPFVLAVGTRMGSEALVFALAQGEPIPASDLRLVEMVGVTALARALENEVVDAAILSLDEALQMGDGGQPVRIALMLEKSKGSDVLLAKSGFSRIEDLRGRRIGVELRSAGHYLLHKALRSVDMGLEDVQLIPLTAREVPNALESQVEALVVTEPDLQHIVVVGATRLFDSNALAKPIIRVLAVREAVWDEHRAVMQEICFRYFAAEPRMTPEDVDFVAFISRRTGLSERDVVEAIERCDFLGRQEMVRMADTGEIEAVLNHKRSEMILGELLVGQRASVNWIGRELWELR